MNAPEPPNARTPLNTSGVQNAPEPPNAQGLLHALRAEWAKLRTLSGTWWLLLAVVAATGAVGSAAAASATCQAAGCGQDQAKLALSGVDLSQAVVAVLAVLAISGEYSTGMMRTTLTAMPHRINVLAAKAVVVTGLALAAGAAGVLASVLAGQLILPGRGFTRAHGYPALSLASTADLRAAAGSVLYLALIALLALGVAAAARDSAVSIGAVLGLLYLFPVIASAAGPDWSRRLQQIGPMSAGLAVQATTGLASLPLSPWQGLGVLALWAAGALLAGGLVLRLRDA
jgi:ABC-2 type transport system permease protein